MLMNSTKATAKMPHSRNSICMPRSNAARRPLDLTDMGKTIPF